MQSATAITRLAKGETDIRLIIITPDVLKRENVAGELSKTLIAEHPPLAIFRDDLYNIHRGIYRLLGEPFEAKIRIWGIRGKLDGFSQDFLVTSSKGKKKE